MNIEEFDWKTYVLAASVLALGVFVFLGSTQGSNGADAGGSSWQDVRLQDVNSGEFFTIGGLEKPLLVETFAVWCPTCTNQQNEIKKLKNRSNITSVSLDVDPNEDEQQIKRHTEENGFDWRYAVSPSRLTRMLIQEYGNSIANPPSAPVIVVCDNTTDRLSNGVKTASTLQKEVRRVC